MNFGVLFGNFAPVQFIRSTALDDVYAMNCSFLGPDLIGFSPVLEFDPTFHGNLA